MVEIKEHIIYDLLKTKYDRLGIDFVILSIDEDYEGLGTHKMAVLTAFNILNDRFTEYDFSVDVRPDEMVARECSMDELLADPPEYYVTRPEGNRSFNIPEPTPYWYAFLEPPYGTHYLKSDFEEFNNVLFPDKNDVEVYRWNDDFSDYFDAGKEWWGTGLWTAFDKSGKTMIVIAASLTD